MRRPVNEPYTITTEFGTPDSYAKFGYHSGVDYAVPTGTAVYAPVRGTVVFADFHPIRGYMVCIYDGQCYHRLMHNSRLLVSQGQQVSEGAQVSLSGSTGLSTGPHVHWDINNEGVEVNSFSRFIDPASLLFASPSPSPSQSLSLAPNQRLLESLDGVNQRTEPTTSSAIIKEWPYDQDPFTFDGFTHGQDPYGNGNDIWFHGAISGGWFYSGCFQNKTTSGLSEIATPTPVIQDVAPPTPVPAPDYSSIIIDVSSHQEKSVISIFNKVRGVIIKAGHTGQSYGGSAGKVDSHYQEFVKAARTTGKIVGHYWYFYPDEGAKVEAERFIAALKSVGIVSGERLFLDAEEAGTTQADIDLFTKTVTDATGIWCETYIGRTVRDNLAITDMDWYPDYTLPAGTYRFDSNIHQYTSTGRIDGYSGNLDLNVTKLSDDEWRERGKIIQPTPAPAPDPKPVVTPPQVEPEVPVHKDTVLKALIQRAFSTAWQAGLAVIVAGAAGIVDIKSAKALAIAAIAAAFSAAKNAVQKPTEG